MYEVMTVPELATQDEIKTRGMHRGVALVVDDDRANRLLLDTLLKMEGYDVVEAEDGIVAVEKYTECSPDIIFMDVMMPRLDGYEATRNIKGMTQGKFVPVIFLTALTDEKSLTMCVEAGGDDFLTKPFRHAILKAKIKAVERIRDLYSAVKAHNDELRVLHAAVQHEQEIAERIFSTAVTAHNVALDYINAFIRPATTFNGDILLTARRPSGDVNILLGDFTGHGLTAAVGALPVSEAFRAMTAKGFSAGEILKEINHKLHVILPTGKFLAACLVTIESSLKHIAVWNGGLPDVMVVGRDGGVRASIPSTHLPLGIVASIERDVTLHREKIHAGDRVLLHSDGLIESRNYNGEMFGSERLIACINQGSPDDVFSRVIHHLDTFCQGNAHEDDISFVDIPCEASLFEMVQESVVLPEKKTKKAVEGGWRWQFEAHGPGLYGLDLVPLAIAQIQEVHGLSNHRESLYTVLFELVTNSLDHGLLGLDSSLKNSAEGFSLYYDEREKRLSELTSGFIRIELMNVPNDAGGDLVISIEDSGEGFDAAPLIENAAKNMQSNQGFSGRGIPLVKSLCKTLVYNEKGNRVEALYSWTF